jgi:hypothetical protein
MGSPEAVAAKSPAGASPVKRVSPKPENKIDVKRMRHAVQRNARETNQERANAAKPCTLKSLITLLQNNGENMILNPPDCPNKRCPFCADCLMGQRYALAKRLVQLQYVLFGDLDTQYLVDR